MVSKARDVSQHYSTIVAIDPGIRASGVAVFHRGSLVAAKWVKGHESDVVSWTQRQVLGIPQAFVGRVCSFVEEPIVVRGRAFRGKTESLLQLSQTVGMLRAMFEGVGVDVGRVPVRDWKRNVPTEALHERLERKLDEHEKSVIQWPAKSAAHNVVDAISIGLWALGR